MLPDNVDTLEFGDIISVFVWNPLIPVELVSLTNQLILGGGNPSDEQFI